MLILAICSLAFGQEFLQHRNHFVIDKWKFYKGESSSAENAGEIDNAGWQDITVPHTWNATDVLTDGPRYYQGVGWYRTNFNLHRDGNNKRFFIRFEGVSLVTDVFINGRYLGNHKGGYSAFIFEITPFVKNDAVNFLSVKVNNITQMDVAPSGTHLYPIFGGIYRPVTVFSTDETCISPLDYASSGIYIHPKKTSREYAEIDVETLIDYDSPPFSISKSLELLPPKGMKGIGLYGEYFSNAEFKGTPTHTRIDEEINFQFGSKSPYEDMAADNFSIIWTGRFIPEKTGRYKFLIKSDDGTRLYIDGKKVIDNWGNHAPVERSCIVDLKANQGKTVRIEFNEIGGGASVEFRWMFIPQLKKTRDAIISLTMHDSEGTVVTQSEKNISIRNHQKNSITQHLKILNPHLWDAKRNPYLYSLNVKLKDLKGNTLDELMQPIGLRYFKVDQDSGLILNGKPYDLYGVCRHQEWQGLGPALTDSEHIKDFEIIKEIGATGIRFAHYQQADIMYRLCDENGLIAWAEIPNTPSYRQNLPPYLHNCRDQLTELIKQNYNHPAILFWGLYNEIDIPKEDVAVLHKTAKQLDPNRLTTAADYAQPNERHYIPDVSAWNWYFGWYYGNFGDYIPWYENLHLEHPKISAGLSEYGAEACISQQQENPDRPDPVGKFFPEQYQREYHEEVWKRIKDRRDIWCKFIWNMFDFSWTNVNRGDKPYKNYKGLVTHDRKVKKDTFYFYKANWSNEPVLYIASRRNIGRKDSNVSVEVYTNIGEVELSVNGNLISKKKMDSEIHKIKWEQVGLKSGKNQIKVASLKDGKTFTDECEWNLSR
jgi:hypothetical protein